MLVVIVAALIGGLAADRLVHASLLIAVIVSLVAGGLAAVVLLRLPPASPELTSGFPDDETRGFPAPQGRHAPTLPRAQPRPRAPDAPQAPGAPRAAAPASFSPAGDPVAPGAGPDGQVRGGSETVVQLLPLPGQAGQADAPWWDSAQGTPAPSAGAKRVPAPDLSTYLASTFIAQCPRCGAFRFDHRRARNGWDFRCESCDHVWTWQPGTPWPPVRVMPGGARPPAP
ncbi:MAG TPA: hypothetical protein VGU21_03645 [Streptosporangiaceae bacterium]|nr:hypothetical protein [Streptosporangiaceae bacterium]